jgi:hypothetical protein
MSGRRELELFPNFSYMVAIFYMNGLHSGVNSQIWDALGFAGEIEAVMYLLHITLQISLKIKDDL